MRTYLEERKRLASASVAKRQGLEQQLGKLNREIDRLVDAIAKGLGDPSILGPRSTALGAERKRISEELQNAPPAAKEVALHPAILKRYEEQLGRLEEALAKGISAGDGEAAEAIRDLVETVTVFRDPERPGSVTVEIAGRLNALLGEKAYPNRVKGVWGKIVGGERYQPTLHLFSVRPPKPRDADAAAPTIEIGSSAKVPCPAKIHVVHVRLSDGGTPFEPAHIARRGIFLDLPVHTSCTRHLLGSRLIRSTIQELR
ncbi:hypothetical protein [Bradyrhizobium elkanii]